MESILFWMAPADGHPTTPLTGIAAHAHVAENFVGFWNFLGLRPVWWPILVFSPKNSVYF